MIFTKLSFAILVSLVLDLNGQYIPTCDEVYEMKGTLILKMEEDELQDGNMQAAALRLGFHQCIDGCDGCVDLQNPMNRGLDVVINQLNELHRMYNFKVSLADFYALAAVVAVERGVKLSNKNRQDGKTCPEACFDLSFGRIDGNSCDGELVPQSFFTHSEMMNYFAQEFGFTKEEAVALMGGHALGGAKRENTGFVGYWTKGEKHYFDEKYYSNMIDPNIRYVNFDASTTRYETNWQFTGYSVSDDAEKSFMLNVDFELFYDLIANEAGKTECPLDHTCGPANTCTQENCQKSDTHDQAMRYSQDCNLFINDFVSVFHKVLHDKNSGLTNPRCPC